MSDSNRGERNQALSPAFAILTAFALVSIIVGVLAYSQGAEGERRNNAPTAYAEAAKEDALRTCTGGEAATVADCVYEKIESSQEQAQAEQDLDAQQNMSLWAAIMAALTFGTLILTGFALWFIKGTLDATADMVGEAKELTGETIKATKAMVRANEIAADAQRPWVGIDVVPKLFQTKGQSFYVELVVLSKNFGQLPAANLNIKFKLLWTENGEYDLVRQWWKKFTPREESNRGLILPQDTLRFPFWSYNSRMTVPYRVTADRSYTVPLFIVSVMYQSSVTGDKWLRTDRAFSIARPGKGFRADTTFNEDVEYDLGPDDLFMEQITYANLGD